jgi:predicted nucleic acid-binding protein
MLKFYESIATTFDKVFEKYPPNAPTPNLFKKAYEIYIAADLPDVEKFEIFVESVGPMTLMIDEANIYFVVDNAAPSPILNSFIRLSKQERLLSVVLACSSFSFPFQLSKLKIKTEHLTKVVVLHEIPPNELYKLLVDKVHMGEHLAIALISYYGGSLLRMQTALSELSIDKEEFQLAIPSAIEMNIRNTLKEAKDANIIDGVKEVLKLLWSHGFAKIDYGSKVAEVLTQNNVAAYVFGDDFYCGVPVEVRNGHDGLIPALQLYRTAISKCL